MTKVNNEKAFYFDFWDVDEKKALSSGRLGNWQIGNSILYCYASQMENICYKYEETKQHNDKWRERQQW